MFFLKAERLPTPETEYRFHPERRWRFDCAYPELKIGIELEGGTWHKSRHTTGKGFANDCLKYSEAALLGWCVLRFTTDQVHDGTAVAMVRRALERRAA